MTRLRTTVIGSHPVIGTGAEAVRNAVQDQVEAGIDIVSDGQTRKDMIAYFADHIPGFKVEDGRSYIVGKVEPPGETPIIQDLLLAKEVAKGRDVKAIITGPVTMIFFSELDPSAPYKGFRDEALYRDVAGALVVEAEMMQRAGSFVYQIDEPSYSIGAPMALAKDALEEVAESIKGKRALHVCGNLKRSFKDIVAFEGIDVLSFAFRDNVSNFDNVDRRMLEDYGKKLGVGCVSSTDGNVESEEVIRGVVLRALETFGADNIEWIHPDCGLRSLARESAKPKLKNLVSVAKSLAGRL